MAAMKTWIALLLFGLILTACGSGSTPTMQTNSQPAAAPPPPRKGPDETAALDAIGKINAAQSTYFKVNRRYALSYDELIEAHLLMNEPTAAQTGYEFKLRPAADAQTYKLSVGPAVAFAPARHFFTDQTGVVHAEDGKDATADSPKLTK